MDARDELAKYHKLTKEESNTLLRCYIELKTEIEVILRRAGLNPESSWFPSADFEWLIKQETIDA